MVADYPAPGDVPVGGPQVATARLVTELARRGVAVTVVRPGDGHSRTTSAELEDGATLLTVPVDERWSLLKRLRTFRRGVRRVVDQTAPAVVHAQELVPCGFASSDVTGVPRIVTAHGNMREDTLASLPAAAGMVRAILRGRLAAAAVERADVVIGVNPDWQVNVPRPPRRFVYVPNIIEERYFTLRRRPERGLVLFAGGSRAIKGWELLARAWPRVRAAVDEAHLLLVGWEGPAPATIPAGSRSSLSVEGWLSAADFAERLSRASALVIPSTFEVAPVVLGEAWALGVPVVAAPVGGLKGLAEGAALVPARREAVDFADAIVAALAGGEAVDQLVANGRSRAEAGRAAVVAEAHLTLYHELAGSGALPPAP